MSTENQSELNLLCYPNSVPECHIKDSCVVVEIKLILASWLTKQTHITVKNLKVLNIS